MPPRKAPAAPEPDENPVAPDTSPEAPKSPWASNPFIDLKGKAYLPARRRVQWFRGEPVPHPDWTIDTEIVEHEKGKRTSPTRVEGGYALVRANIFDEEGRLIASSVKSEFSENFMDFLEKAETGAIARALALCGYGTESALDLDEGIGENGEPRIADSPVAITRSEIPNVGRGGKSTSPTDAQVSDVARQAARLGLDAAGVTGIIGGVLPELEVPEMTGDAKVDSNILRGFLGSLDAETLSFIVMTFERAGR
jgi:hypothetical protein